MQLKLDKQFLDVDGNSYSLEINEKTEWLEGIYNVKLINSKLPRMSADELMSFIIDLEAITKLHSEDEKQWKYNLAKDMQALYRNTTGEIPFPDMFKINQYKDLFNFRRSLKSHKKWINNYIDMWNLLSS